MGKGWRMVLFLNFREMVETGMKFKLGICYFFLKGDSTMINHHEKHIVRTFLSCFPFVSWPCKSKTCSHR